MLRWCAFLVIMIFGNSFLLHEANLLWEVPLTKDAGLEKHKVGIVLGGYAYYNPENDRIVFRENTDRLMQGIRLLKTGKIDKLMLSGGSGLLLKPDMKEALYVREYLDEIGIKNRKLIIESESRNTHENAAQSKDVLDALNLSQDEILLITSARHMRRSRACFEKVGFKVQPYPTDIMTGDREFGIAHLLIPNAYTLQHWNAIFHEWVGYLSYKVTGYA